MPPTAEQIRDQVERAARARALRDAFIAAFGVRKAKWSAHNLARMLNASGHTREVIAAARAILGKLGLGDGQCERPYYQWICTSGVFDHGEMWSFAGLPSILVGHPYQIGDDERDALGRLDRLGGFRVAIDDRPSYYGFGTHHVRVELVGARKPFTPIPSTPKTRAYARAARAAFSEAFGEAK
jgi:hypothetical protein